MNRKQLILVIVSFLIVLILIIASSVLQAAEVDDDRPKVVATFYPLAYMAHSIGGDRVNVVSLLPPNADPHSADFHPGDIIIANNADLILYNGGPADAWLVDEIFPSINKNNKLIVNTTEGMKLIAGGDKDEGGIDPHTWVSPKRALIQARNIFDALCQVDSNGTEYYAIRFAELNQTLAQLDEGYQALNQSSVSGIIVSHSAYGYVAYDYGFEQYGMIGMNAEQGPSPHIIDELATIMLNKSIYTIYVDPAHYRTYAQTMKSAAEDKTNHVVTLLNLYLILGPVDDMDYLELLSKNLMNLRTGLNVAQGS